jgi:mannosyl-3-phosphoglycerate phosphatase
MKVRAVFTDLDGTLLEPDGSLRAEAMTEIGRLTALGIPVCLVTSKTATEVVRLLARLRLETPAGFENGAGVVLANGSMVLDPAALSMEDLRRAAASLRGRCAAPIKTLDELDDRELRCLTGLPETALGAVRDRQATLPIVVAPQWDGPLRETLPSRPRMRLLRGNRFLHLQGDHDKTSVMQLLLSRLPPREGVTVSCGDSPNDLELLTRTEIAVIVPSHAGPSSELVRKVPGAFVAPEPHGRGWAMAVREIVERTTPWR